MHEDNNKKFVEYIKKVLLKLRPRFSFHYVAYTTLFFIIIFSVVSLVNATTPNPGHPWVEVGDGVFTFTSGQTATNYTYTFPAANTTALTTNAAVTVAQGGTGLGSLTANNVILGNGTGTPTFVAPGTNGNVLTSNGTTWTSSAPTASGANALGTYIVQTATNAPANAQILASLGTGIVKNTTTTGVLSIATAGDFPTLNQNTSGAAALTGITEDTTTAVAVYPTWVTSNTGNLGQYVSSTKLSFIPNTGVLTSTGFAATGVLSSGTNGGTGGQLTLSGATSGSAILKVSAVASNPTLTLPTTTGTLALLSDISGGYVPYTGGTTNVDLGVHNLTVDTNTISVDSATHRLGVGVTSPSYKLDISGDMQLQNGIVGIGATPDVNYEVNVGKTFDASANQSGIRNLIYFSPSSNSGNIGYGFISSARKSGNFDVATIDGVYALTANSGNGNITSANAIYSSISLFGTSGTGTITNANGLISSSPVRDAGNTGTIGTLAGVRIQNQGNSYVTNAYGLYVENQTGAVTNNYAIYSGGGINYFAGNVGIGQTVPTAVLHLKAGSATANTAPLKFTSGTVLSTTEAGAVEYDGSHLYFTVSNGGTRYQLDQQSGAGANALGTYIVQSSTNAPANAQILGSLGTGIVKNTTTSSTGVLSIAVAGDFPTLNQNTSGAAALTGITNDTTNPSAVYPTWVTANTGNLGQYVSSTKLSFVPNTGVLTSTALSATGVLSSGTNGATGGQLTLFGATSGTGILKVSTTAGSGIVFQLPSSNGSNTNVLQTDGAGVTSWVAAPLTAWDAIADPSGNGSIAFGSTVQTMDWATATTTNPLAITAAALTTGELLNITSNSLTSGTLLDVNSVGTGALTNQKGLNIALSGANGTDAQTTYGAYISNTHAGTTSTNVGLYATATGGTTANYAAIFENGKVGIGTTAPSYKLAVSGTAATDGVRSDMGFDIYQVPDPTAPTGVVSAGGSVDTGAHWYAVSYTTAVGETHTIYTAAQITTTAGNNTVTLTIPVSTDPRVTGRKIYRTKAGVSTYLDYLLTTIANNTATSYVDTAADSTLSGSSSAGFFRINTTSKGLTVGGTNSFNIDSKSILIGVGVGGSLTTGGRNILIGAGGTGAGMTSGSANTIVGAYIPGPSTGSNNTIMGTFSGGSNNTGSNNTLVGTYSMEINVGDNNSAFGQGSGDSLTTGSNNTFIGSYAGNNASQLVSAQNSMALGYQAYTTASNQVVIGNSSITQTLLNGSVGLGLGYTAPTARLQLPAGTATASTAPLKFTSGTVLGTTEAGAVEYDGTHLYFTATNGGSRYQLDQQSGGSMSIGGAVTSGTSGSILFVNSSNQLAQNNSNFFWDDANTQLEIGGGANYTYATTTAAPLNIAGTVDTSLQANIQNKSTGLNASSDWVATANNGTDSTYYIDMGINGSGYTGGVFGAANDAYLYNMGQNLYIGTGTAAKSLSFLTGGTSVATNTRLTIDGTGNITSYLGAGIQQKVTATAAPTNDMFTITNTGFANTTAGASALQVTYVGGATAGESSAARIDTTPGATSGGQWNGLRIVPSSSAASGVVSVGLKLENNGSAILNGVDRAIEVSGQGWDSGLAVFEAPVAVNSPFGGIGRYQNFLLQSENFATTWTTSNATATANQTGPNSIANRAYSIATSVAGGYVQQSASVGVSALTGRTFNFSVWLKAASNITSQLSLTSATPTTPITQNISVGTSWRRYSVTGTYSTDAATAVIVRILPTSSGTGTVYAWGAQLEESTSAGVYAATGASLLANTNNTGKNNGIVANNSLKINATSIPTLDMVAIGNQGYGVTAAGVSALQIDFAGGINAIEASAQRIDLTGGTTAGSTWNGLRIVQGVITAGTSAQDFKMETAALTQTTGVTTNLRGLNLAVAGTLSTTTTGASNIINWTGINLVTPTLSAGIASSAINADNLKITTSASVTATGTVINNGINIAAAGSAGTLNGILISGITPSTGAETGLNIGSGWDSAIKITDSQATTNSLVNITTSNTAQTGNSLLVQTASTGTVVANNGLVFFNFNGIRTGSGTAFQVTDVSTTLATAMGITTNALTTGKALNISSTSTGLTTAGTNTGTLFNVVSTGVTTAQSGNLAEIAATTGARTTFTGNLLEVAMTGASAATNTGSLINITDTGAANLTKLLNLSASTTAATTQMMKMTYAGLATVATTNTYIQFLNSAAAQQGAITGTGTPGNVLYTTTSDARMKHDIIDTHFGITDLMNITVHDFVFNADSNNNIQTGFVAQELYKIYPQAVATNGDDGTIHLNPNSIPWSIDYGKITPLLVKSIQDMNLKLLDINNMEKPNDWRDNITAWFANTKNGITEFVAGIVRAKDQLCIGEGSDAVCITKDDLIKMKASSGGATTPNVIYIAPSDQNIPDNTTSPESNAVTPEVPVENPDTINTTPPTADVPTSPVDNSSSPSTN
jgi:hypothetical protein